MYVPAVGFAVFDSLHEAFEAIGVLAQRAAMISAISYSRTTSQSSWLRVGRGDPLITRDTQQPRIAGWAAAVLVLRPKKCGGVSALLRS